MTTTNSIHCDKCETFLKSEKCYASHLKSKRHIQRVATGGPPESAFVCACRKSFSYRQTLHFHQKKCEPAIAKKLLPLPVKQSTAVIEAKNKESLFCIEYQNELNKFNVKLDSYKAEQNEIRKKYENEISNLKTQNAILSGENEIIKMQAKIAIISGENEIKKLKMQTSESKEILVPSQKNEIDINNNAPEQKRKRIAPDKRNYIAKKQGNLCGMCKRALSSVFEIDHITGKQFGGTNEETNLMALCCECHANKSIIENKCRKQIRETIQFIIMENQDMVQKNKN